MNVLAFDLSLTATGVAYPDGSVDLWHIKATGTQRLAWFRDSVSSVLTSSLDLIVLEGYAYGRPQQATGIGELGGVVRLCLHDRELPWVAIPPANLKQYATGRGNANKAEVLLAAVRRLGYEGHDDNEADAMWLRAMALDHYGSPLVELPALHRKALTKVRWPVLGTVKW